MNNKVLLLIVLIPQIILCLDESKAQSNVLQAPAGPRPGHGGKTNIEKCSNIVPESDIPCCYPFSTVCGGSAGACCCYICIAAGVPIQTAICLSLSSGVACNLCGLTAKSTIEQFGSKSSPAARVAVRDESTCELCKTVVQYRANQCLGSTCRAYAGCLEGVRDCCAAPLYKMGERLAHTAAQKACVVAVVAEQAGKYDSQKARTYIASLSMVQTGDKAVRRILDAVRPDQEHKN